MYELKRDPAPKRKTEERGSLQPEVAHEMTDIIKHVGDVERSGVIEALGSATPPQVKEDETPYRSEGVHEAAKIRVVPVRTAVDDNELGARADSSDEQIDSASIDYVF